MLRAQTVFLLLAVSLGYAAPSYAKPSAFLKTCSDLFALIKPKASAVSLDALVSDASFSAETLAKMSKGDLKQVAKANVDQVATIKTKIAELRASASGNPAALKNVDTLEAAVDKQLKSFGTEGEEALRAASYKPDGVSLKLNRAPTQPNDILSRRISYLQSDISSKESELFKLQKLEQPDPATPYIIPVVDLKRTQRIEQLRSQIYQSRSGLTSLQRLNSRSYQLAENSDIVHFSARSGLKDSLDVNYNRIDPNNPSLNRIQESTTSGSGLYTVPAPAVRELDASGKAQLYTITAGGDRGYTVQVPEGSRVLDLRDPVVQQSREHIKTELLANPKTSGEIDAVVEKYGQNIGSQDADKLAEFRAIYVNQLTIDELSRLTSNPELIIGPSGYGAIEASSEVAIRKQSLLDPARINEDAAIDHRSLAGTPQSTRNELRQSNVFSDSANTRTVSGAEAEKLFKSVDWSQSLPADIKKSATQRMEAFRKRGGRIEIIESREHASISSAGFYVSESGHPTMKISRDLLESPETLGPTLAHELDHFVRIERLAQKLRKASPSMSVAEARHSALQQSVRSPGAVSALEESATRIGNRAVNEQTQAIFKEYETLIEQAPTPAVQARLAELEKKIGPLQDHDQSYRYYAETTALDTLARVDPQFLRSASGQRRTRALTQRMADLFPEEQLGDMPLSLDLAQQEFRQIYFKSGLKDTLPLSGPEYRFLERNYIQATARKFWDRATPDLRQAASAKRADAAPKADAPTPDAEKPKRNTVPVSAHPDQKKYFTKEASDRELKESLKRGNLTLAYGDKHAGSTKVGTRQEGINEIKRSREAMGDLMEENKGKISRVQMTGDYVDGPGAFNSQKRYDSVAAKNPDKKYAGISEDEIRRRVQKQNLEADFEQVARGFDGNKPIEVDLFFGNHDGGKLKQIPLNSRGKTPINLELNRGRLPGPELKNGKVEFPPSKRRKIESSMVQEFGVTRKKAQSIVKKFEKDIADEAALLQKSKGGSIEEHFGTASRNITGESPEFSWVFVDSKSLDEFKKVVADASSKYDGKLKIKVVTDQDSDLVASKISGALQVAGHNPVKPTKFTSPNRDGVQYLNEQLPDPRRHFDPNRGNGFQSRRVNILQNSDKHTPHLVAGPNAYSDIRETFYSVSTPVYGAGVRGPNQPNSGLVLYGTVDRGAGPEVRPYFLETIADSSGKYRLEQSIYDVDSSPYTAPQRIE